MTDHGDRLPGLDREAQLGEDRHAGPVAEAHPLELDPARERRGLDRVATILHQLVALEDLEQPLARGLRAGGVQDHPGELVDWRVEVPEIRGKQDERAGRDRVAEREPAAEPQHAAGARGDQDVAHPLEGLGQPHGGQAGGEAGTVLGDELFLKEILAAVGLHQRQRRDVLRHQRGDLALLAPLLTCGRLDAPADVAVVEVERRDRGACDRGQAPVQREHQPGVRENQGRLVGERLRHLDQQDLQVAHVRHQPQHEVAGARGVVEGEGQTLDVGEQPLPDLDRHPRPDGHEADPVDEAEQAVQEPQRDEHEDEPRQQRDGVGAGPGRQPRHTAGHGTSQHHVIQDQLERPWQQQRGDGAEHEPRGGAGERPRVPPVERAEHPVDAQQGPAIESVPSRRSTISAHGALRSAARRACAGSRVTAARAPLAAPATSARSGTRCSSQNSR